MSFGAVAAIGGAVIGASASRKASKAQSNAAENTDATNRYIFNKQTSLQEPFRQGGLLANNQLLHLLGLGGTASGAQNTGAAPQKTYDQYRQELLGKYTKTGPESFAELGQYTIPGASTVDESGLNAEIQRLLASQSYQPQPQGGPDDPSYGSLMKKFGMEDFEADPGYEFRRTEGMRGVEGSAAARGGLLSGAAQKAIQKYGQGLASQEYGNAYQRYNADQTNQYNRLAGVVNTGQGATNQVSNAAAQYGQNTASNNAALGNAQAAGAIGQANAWSQGLGGVANSLQQNELMKMIKNPGTSQTMDWYN